MAPTTRAAKPKPEEATAKPEKKESVQQLKNRLRNEAEREVLDAHKKEVIAKTEAKYKANGLEYVRRLTEEEKAAKAIEEHFKQYPNLRSQFIPAPQQQAQRTNEDVLPGQPGYPFTEGYEPVTRETLESDPEFAEQRDGE